MYPRILAFAWLLGACTVPPIPTPPPLPPLPPRPSVAAAEPPPAAVPAPAPAPEPVAAAPAPRGHPPETVALFVANCAQCHGEKGDGEGVTQLDRKARSFLDGGFSYGNTPDAIFRSITHGIPGTPMPGFEKPLSEATRRELATYVIALGPADQIVVDAKDSEIVVNDKPVIVRGKLPPIAEGAPEWPRGLAIGTPEGLTFEYRVDDVQLLAVRAGRFLNRKDWGGRGGDPLEMLGKTVWAAKPTSSVVSFPTGTQSVRGDEGGADVPAISRLIASEVHDGVAVLEYEARNPQQPAIAGVVVLETVRGFQCELGAGFVRHLSVRGADATQPFRVTHSVMTDGFPNADAQSERGLAGRANWACRHPSPGTVGELTAIVADRDFEATTSRHYVAVGGGEVAEVALFVIPSATVPLNDAERTQLLRRVFGRLE